MVYKANCPPWLQWLCSKCILLIYAYLNQNFSWEISNVYNRRQNSITKHLPPGLNNDQFSSVQLFSRVRLFVTPWTTAYQASLSITNSQSSPKPMFFESVMPSTHLILCHPLLLLPSIFPSIRVFSNESAFRIRWPKYWSFSFTISLWQILIHLTVHYLLSIFLFNYQSFSSSVLEDKYLKD